MKYCILILFLFFTVSLQSQISDKKFKFYSDSLNFAQAKKKANEDLKKGIYRAYLFRQGKGYSKTFQKILEKDFGIIVLLFQSCLKNNEPSFIDYYNNISIPIIMEKFGDNIFEKTRLKAEKLDKLGKGERNSNYPNGHRELMKFIYCQLDNEILKKHKSKKDYPTPTVTLYISKEGKAYNQKIEFCKDENVIKEIKRIVKLIPTFEYATKNGKPVESVTYFPIHFHKKWKIKTCR
ncbi:hypothetical protein [Lacinutrix algicola]|uniref:hypothetical protein n=1 Tax=Lacinutrix algicola TaxID=342954 RepID=UPI0006E3D0C0|nr:hypothetical protein [Lacinutrix algicola]